MQNRNRLTDIENKLIVTKGEMREYRIKSYKLLCIKQRSNKDISYSTGNYSHFLVITSKGV